MTKLLGGFTAFGLWMSIFQIPITNRIKALNLMMTERGEEIFFHSLPPFATKLVLIITDDPLFPAL
jgi:hypothetical protein